MNKACNDAKCKSLELLSPILLKKDDKKSDTGDNFQIKAYTGEVVDRWWGRLAIDIEGVQARDNMPVLKNHHPDYIVGFTTQAYKDGSFFVDGKFSAVTDSAKEVKGLAEEGFPWQASIGVYPTKILSLEKDGTMDVNGKTVTGPAEIWVESVVEEVSFVPLGADSSTEVTTFSKVEEVKQPDMPADDQLTENKQFEALKTAEDFKIDIEIKKMKRNLCDD